ncbi:MAG: hypothetical protein HQK97_12420 [Nitrospirae bacterium]|nr:hypothetical protein [Nitrospirota bacterium]
MDKKVCYLKDEKTGKFMGSKAGCVNKIGNNNIKNENKKKTAGKPAEPTVTGDSKPNKQNRGFKPADLREKREKDLEKKREEEMRLPTWGTGFRG